MRKGIWNISCKLQAISYKLRKIHSQLVACSLLLLSFLIPHTSFAQSASAFIDRDKILLGEQVTLKLKAENINTQTSPLLNWFSLSDTSNHIEVVKRSPIDTVEVNGTTSYVQTITLTSFDSGDWKLLPFYVVIQGSEDGKKDTLRAGENTLQVLPVDVSNLKQYHPMKDIIDVDVKPDYLLMAGITLGILAVAIIIWLLVKKKKEIKPSLQPVAMQSLFETTISQLEQLQRENSPAQLFYNKLDDICRTFIQNQLHIRAMQLTTDELMVPMNVYIQQESRVSFCQLLRLISAVKFAKYQPAEAQKADAVNTAKEAVSHIYYNLQHNLTQHVS